MRFIKNKFLFIILISAITLVLLVVGAMMLYQDTSSVFKNDGYIISTATTKKQYHFSANTKYKENVDKEISFVDSNSKTVSVDPASFVHYSNGDISFLKKGALVNVSELKNPMVTYYNVTDENSIVYDKGGYTVSSNGKTINIPSFIGRISDNKYIIAGDNISLKVPSENERIKGNYFEILFVEDGIVKIDNEDHSYQVTAQESYIYIDDNVVVSLGDGKISVDGDTKMLLSQITISGDENIDLDVVSEKGSGSGTGDGNGTGTTDANQTDATGDGNGTGVPDPNATDANGNGSGGTGGGDDTTASPQIELINAEITSTTIDLSLQLNNAALATNPIGYYFVDVSTGKKVDAEDTYIDLVNGTFQIRRESLKPSTEYTLVIGELDDNNGKQYFQKTFKTDDLGISMDKVYATSESLAYKINFDENTEVSRVQVSIYDSNGSNEKIEVNQYIISKEDLSKTFVFEGLESNSRYSVIMDKVWIDNAAYTGVYSISRIDSTLKLTPVLSNINVSTNAEEIKFTIQLQDVYDPDSAIINYIYDVYDADSVNSDSNATPVYSVTKTDTDALVLDLKEINELKTGANYRVKIRAQYSDNEMIREVSSDFSGNFLIKGRANITFDDTTITMNSASGTLTLVDPNCSIPVSGRSCLSQNNRFILRYYKVKDGETTDNDMAINFNPNSLTTGISLDSLSSNTSYAMKLFGTYYDDNNEIHENVQIGDTLFFTTDKSPNLYFEVLGDNTSGKNKDGTENAANVVTFDAKISAPQGSNVLEEISSITLNLYSGRYNTSEKMIGTYTLTSKEEISDFFNNYTITNSLFTDTTKNKLGKLDSLNKLIAVTNNSTNSLNGSYTVEVVDVYDDAKVNKFTIEDNVYTFNLTSSYYLDTRIATNPNATYITATPILKKNLSQEDYENLIKTVPNLDDLNDDTVVGLTIENSLSDLFVDSAFTYERVTVEYTIFNSTTSKMARTLEENMGNKYQPKTQVVYLDPSEMDDGSNFTRGYVYRVGYHLKFITEDGSNPVYTNDKLYKNVTIERQNPIYTQFILNSSDIDITYRYTISDVDKAIANNSFYYKVGDGNYTEIKNSLVSDGNEHEVVVPVNDRVNYLLGYSRKTVNNGTEYVSISEYGFEKEYGYNNAVSFEIVKDNDNVLKLKLFDNDVTNRAVAYKVTITSVDGKVSEYSSYFLANRLSTLSENTSSLDENGNPIVNTYPYIAIDYANISKFMKHEMVVSVVAYYDSGLVGLLQNVEKGFILKANNKYLNVFNGNVGTSSYSRVGDVNLGLYLLKSNYDDSTRKISLYNHLIRTDEYKPFVGSRYYGVGSVDSSIGVSFDVSASNAGIVYSNKGSNIEYTGYNIKALKEATLKATNYNAIFNEIIPTVSVTTKSTINSINVSMTAKGIYGNTQFVKDGASHKKVYITFYGDSELQNELSTLVSNVTINGSADEGYTASIDSVDFNNLKPATTYYFTISAYIDGIYTRLYDSVENTSYIFKNYSASTLSGIDILSNMSLSVKPVSYHGETSLKNFSWYLELNSTVNYKLRMELYKKNSEGEYILSNIDGTDGTSCDINTVGTEENGYVNNCYILVDKDKVNSINKKIQTYSFDGNDFVFGNGYYKFVIYAIPYTNGSYLESDKVLLFDKEELSSGEFPSRDGNPAYRVTIPELSLASVSLGDFISGVTTSGNNRDFYLEFTPVIVDSHYVMKYGQYTISILDSNSNVVNSCEVYKNNVKQTLSGSGCSISLDYAINSKIKVGKLSSDTLYYVQITYQTYRNNVGYTEENKVEVSPFLNFIYTPNASGVTLGEISASLDGNKKVILTYSGSSKLTESITKVIYTIRLMGGSSNFVTGTYSNSVNGNVFSITSVGLPMFSIDVSDATVSSNTSFTFKNGATYSISTKYYDSRDEELFSRQTFLNL